MEAWGWLRTADHLERKAWMDQLCASISGDFLQTHAPIMGQFSATPQAPLEERHLCPGSIYSVKTARRSIHRTPETEAEDAWKHLRREAGCQGNQLRLEMGTFSPTP